MPVARQKVIDQEDQGQKIEDEDLGGEDHGSHLTTRFVHMAQ